MSDELPDPGGTEPQTDGSGPPERSDAQFVAPEKTPISFKIMVVLGALYIGWRVIDLILCGAELIGWGSLGPEWCS